MTDPNIIPLPRFIAARALAAFKDMAAGSAAGSLKDEAAELAGAFSDALNTAPDNTYEPPPYAVAELRERIAAANTPQPPAVAALLAEVDALKVERDALREIAEKLAPEIDRGTFEHIASMMLAHLLKCPRDMCGAYELGSYKFETATRTDDETHPF